MHRQAVSAISQPSMEAVSDGLTLLIMQENEEAKRKEGRRAPASCASPLVATRPAAAFPALLQCSTTLQLHAGRPQSSPLSSSTRTLAHGFASHFPLAGRSITIAATVCANWPTANHFSVPIRARRYRGHLAALVRSLPVHSDFPRAVRQQRGGSLGSLGVVWC